MEFVQRTLEEKNKEKRVCTIRKQAPSAIAVITQERELLTVCRDSPSFSFIS